MLRCKYKKQQEILSSTMAIQLELKKIEQITRSCKLPDLGIRIKDMEVMQQVSAVQWHPMLLEVLEWLYQSYPDQIIITKAFLEGLGVHGTIPLRAFDIRSRNFVDPLIIRDHCNSVFNYGKEGYEVCVYHKEEGEDQAWHFHIQVRNETRRRD